MQASAEDDNIGLGLEDFHYGNRRNTKKRPYHRRPVSGHGEHPPFQKYLDKVPSYSLCRFSFCLH